MPILKQWVDDLETPGRHILRLTNETIHPAENLIVIVPARGRLFSFPGPLAIGASHNIWNTPLVTPPDVDGMIIYYDSILGLAIREPLLDLFG